MNLYLTFAVAIFAAIIAAYLKKKNPELGLVFTLSVVVMILIVVMNNIFPIIDKITSYFIADELFFVVPMKILGLSLLSKIAASICEGAGEKGIASTISLVTRISAVLIALPLFDRLLEEIGEILAL
ncbi:MAG: stage III sporulation AC/AD family protein [Oscillospiraceae bacterium]